MPIIQVWKGMRARCNRKTATGYHNYGGRGIKCEWQTFEEFKTDMFDSYQTHFKLHNGDTSIDRIDNNGNYNKLNCKWATRKEQQRHTRYNHFLTYKGESHCLAEWCEMLKIHEQTILYRLRHNWPIEKVLKEFN